MPMSNVSTWCYVTNMGFEITVKGPHTMTFVICGETIGP